MAASRWRHWGSQSDRRKDFPVHEVIIMWQSRIIAQLLSSVTLERMHDTELKVPADQDVLTTAELIERLTKSVFAEVDNTMEGEFTNRKPAITSVRRNLQRSYLQRLSSLAMGQSSAPQDCQTVAFAQLGSLESRINKLLQSKVQLDTYSQAHLQESAARIRKVLDAELSLSGP